MEHKYTGKQVIKAGETLIQNPGPIDMADFSFAMDVLSYWRFSHEHPLEVALQRLREVTLKKDPSAIFAKRLKRYSSIVIKLKRFPTMKLKNMQDIGGCRAIISTPKKITQVVRTLRKMPEFKNNDGKIRAKDYITNPKDDGYRGYHLIGKFPDANGEDKNIEIQLRTHLQHDWATALEIVDLFTGQALKSNQGDKDWKSFFSNVSEQFAIMERIHLFNTLSDIDKFHNYRSLLDNDENILESCWTTQSYCKKLEVIKKLQAFAHSLKIIDNRLSEISGSGYALLVVNTNERTVKSTIFSAEDSKTAESRYLSAEKESAGERDVVVALVSTTAVGGIKEAYPNYFADSTDFLKHLSFIIEVKPIKTGLLSSLFRS